MLSLYHFPIVLFYKKNSQCYVCQVDVLVFFSLKYTLNSAETGDLCCIFLDNFAITMTKTNLRPYLEVALKLLAMLTVNPNHHIISKISY